MATFSRKNNFDIVRLLLALIVVLVHSYDLSGASALAPIRAVLSAHLAVEGFFVISGYLIFASYERCATLREYAANRAWRILPAYWLSTLVCLGIAAAHHCFAVGKFLLANLSFLNFLHPGIRGVFPDNPAGDVMNGALWTIKIEVMFYVAVPFIVWLCRRLQRDAVLLSLFALSLVFHEATAAHPSLQVQLPGQLSFFLGGTLLYYHLGAFKRYRLIVVAAAVVAYGLYAWTGWYPLRPLAIPPLVLAVCLLLPHVEGPARWGDFSYGTYILHWPILQTVIAAGLFVWQPWVALAAALLLVASCAVLSWNFVEKPALAHARSRRLRQAASGHAANFPPAVP